MSAPQMTLDELRDRTVISVWPEAGPLLGLTSESAAYRAAHEWIDSGGERGLPVIRVSARRMVVPVPQLLRLLGADPPADNGGAPATTTAEAPEAVAPISHDQDNHRHAPE